MKILTAMVDESMRYLSAQPYSVLIYLKQEGRGIGLINKIKAYNLQDTGLDTVEANKRLGFPSYMREYSIAAQIIKLLKIRSVVLLTNNPDKINDLKDAGIVVSKRIPLLVPRLSVTALDPYHEASKIIPSKHIVSIAN